MNNYNLDTSIREIDELIYDPILGKIILEACVRSGVLTFGDIMKASCFEFLKIRNVGIETLRIIGAFREKYSDLYKELTEKSTN